MSKVCRANGWRDHYGVVHQVLDGDFVTYCGTNTYAVRERANFEFTHDAPTCLICVIQIVTPRAKTD